MIHEVIPYSIKNGVEEMFNFLLCQEDNPETHCPETRAYALRRILRVNRSDKKAAFDPNVVRHLEQMQKMGPQYAINDDEEVCVRLTDAGLENYKRIYFGKPKYEKMEERPDGHYLFYRCSKDQVFLYFKRFDPMTAEIVSPPSLRIRMKAFFSAGSDLYENE